MRFYGHGVVWDPERKKALARFDKNREFETDDPRTIQILKDSGYLGDYDADDYKLNDQLKAGSANRADTPGTKEKPPWEGTSEEMRAYCKEKGIPGYSGLKKAELKALIKKTDKA